LTAGALGWAAEPAKESVDRRVTRANYDLASRWTAAKVGKLVFDTTVTPRWFESGDKFFYSWESGSGRRFVLVDCVKKTKAPLFDAARMAAQLTLLTKLPFDSQHLPLRQLKLAKNDSVLRFEVPVPRDADVVGATDSRQQGGLGVGGQQQEQGEGGAAGGPAQRVVNGEYDLATGKLTIRDPKEIEPRKPRWAQVSPDGKTIVFVRGENLFMMDADNYAKALKKADDPSIVETQLTTDGVQHYGYTRRLTDQERQEQEREETDQTDGTNTNIRRPSARLQWSKDSKKFSLVRQDQRKVADLWVINSLATPRPKLETYRYGMPGEANQAQSELEVFDVATKKRLTVKAARFADQTVAVATANVTYRDREAERTEAKWLNDDSAKLYFTRTSRDLKKVDVAVADTTSGEVKTLIEERFNTYIDLQPLRLVNNGTELIHWSERDGWGHYYLFDGEGKLKNQITTGEWVTGPPLHVDEKARTLYFLGQGREAGEDPYYAHVYRVGLDGSGLKNLGPGNASHAAALADNGRYFVDTASTVSSAPASVLYDAAGVKVMDLEKADLTRLTEAGYKFPEAFQVKADDGITDIYGVMYKPFDFDPAKKYPIIAYVYPGPQTESVTKTFTPRSPNIALAQMGFIVIEVGNRGGNPNRSKWYHTYGYGNLRDYGLADKKTAIEQLALRHPYIDGERVGIYGHSGGGFMSTAAMLVYPEFFKVAVSTSGNHENNIYNRWWSEKHHGVKEMEDKDGKVRFEYDIAKNSEIAKNLKGHLMLATGDMDDNVHMANTLRMADALIKANKRFDLMVLPGKRHAYGNATNYVFWLRADYFAKHLLGDFGQGVDIVELTREQEQRGDTRRPPARGTQQQQQQGTRGRTTN
jgi:dipeptidyl aminopeptidase/acylaminoacyl peptidase